MITAEQKRKIIQVVNVFETGSTEGKYDNITIMADGKGDTRQITYGRSQATEQGNLKNIIERYVQAGGQFASAFGPYLPKISRQPLVDDNEFKRLLRTSAREDALMRQAQDETFEILYYQPAEHFFKDEGFTLPLSMLVVYDSYIHSGGVPSMLRSRFPEATPVRGGDEKAWVTAYVKVRQDWLATHRRKILRPTVYRTKCFLNEMKKNNWMLDQAVMANGTKVA